jgi:hypothetical protein
MQTRTSLLGLAMATLLTATAHAESAAVAASATAVSASAPAPLAAGATEPVATSTAAGAAANAPPAVAAPANTPASAANAKAVAVLGSALKDDAGIAGVDQPKAAAIAEPVEAIAIETLIETCKTNPEEIYCRLRCQYSEVVCVTTGGVPIPSEIVPESLDPRTTFQVIVIRKQKEGKVPGIRVTETIGGTSYPRLDVEKPPISGTISGSTGVYEWASVSQSMAEDATAERIDFIAPGSQGRIVLSSLTLRSSGGYYFVAYGSGVIVPFGGAPKIETLVPPSGSGLRYETKYDARVAPAFVLQLYPFGHRAQSLSPFVGPAVKPLAGVGRALRDLLSLQLGANLDPTKLLDRILVGVGVEFVTGVVVSYGVSFDRAERYTNGYSNGALASDARESAVEEYLHVSSYLGFALNQRVFEAAYKAYSAFSGQKQ